MMPSVIVISKFPKFPYFFFLNFSLEILTYVKVGDIDAN